MQVIFIAGGKAYELKRNENSVIMERVFCLDSNQEETDTRVVIYARYAAEKGYKSVQIRSPDSDLYFILPHHAPAIGIYIFFDTGSGNKKRLLNVTEQSKELGKEHCEALLSLHALTGCDTTSCFKGKGKIKHLKILEKNKEYEEILSKLGEDWCLDPAISSGIEKFVCHIYGNARHKEVDRLRFHLLQKKCNNNYVIDPKKTLDLGCLPPCKSSLLQHIKRANYQVLFTSYS